MPKHGKQSSEADVAQQAQKSQASEPAKATSPTTKPSGQKVSLERGSHTHHKKNPGKRPKAGGS